MTTEFITQVTSIPVSSEIRISWQRPTLERIDIKRTMGGAGSNADATTNPTSFAP